MVWPALAGPPSAGEGRLQTWRLKEALAAS